MKAKYANNAPRQTVRPNNSPLTSDVKKSSNTYPLITITRAATVQTILYKTDQVLHEICGSNKKFVETKYESVSVRAAAHIDDTYS